MEWNGSFPYMIIMLSFAKSIAKAYINCFYSRLQLKLNPRRKLQLLAYFALPVKKLRSVGVEKQCVCVLQDTNI